ncbi:TonB-dependent receptor [Magnetovibrio sp.]|uniref:TonB-dependent receptor n=1 Tax=Magnetovibrio sp. TaxID=2024836 RepID=UPI002F95D17D
MQNKIWMPGKTGMALSAFLLSTTAAVPLWAQDAVNTQLDEVSVTATRSERGTKEVPASITVIGAKRIDNEKMFNIKDAIQGTPGVQINSANGGFDSRLVIRGAGQKANYGVREIMVMRDGVPMTDPDSFTRFDFIDTQDIERIEVTKGPGSIYGAGSAGGVIQILSKSVFDPGNNTVRLGAGTAGTTNAHARVGSMMGDNDAIAVTFSRRAIDNSWRPRNSFESTQGSIKHGHMFENGGTWESEISFSNVNMEIPGSMSAAQYEEFRRTGKQIGNSDAFDFSGRDSNSYFINSKYELEDGDITYKPRVYANKWSHYHPVTGAINVSGDNVTAGADGEVHYKHQLWGPSTLVAGVSARIDDTNDARKYRYRDLTTGFGGRITAVLSDQPGALLESEDARNTLVGAFAQETVRPNEKTLVDVSLRLDRSVFDIATNEIAKYDFATGTYVAGAGNTQVDKTFDLVSMRIGSSYAWNEQMNVYGSLAMSDQVPSAGEIGTNTSLTASTASTVEVGLKGRQAGLSYDAAVYFTSVQDEIVSVSENGQTTFRNAGEVEKKGLELSATYGLSEEWSIGGNYAFSDFTFKSFNEPVNNVNVSRAGNNMPYVPRHQYSLSVNYDSGWGLTGGLRSETWSAYWMDNANSEKYSSYKYITSANVSYDISEKQSFSLNVENILDKHYAVEAKKSTRGVQTYSAAQPRTFVLTYRQDF